MSSKKEKRKSLGDSKVTASTTSVPTDEPATQPKSARLTKGKQAADRTAANKEPAQKKQKKVEEKVEVVVEEPATQPKSVKLTKGKQTADHTAANKEPAQKKQKKAQEKVEVVVEEPATQPKSAKLTKGKQTADHTASNKEPAQKKQKKVEAKVGIASDEAVPQASAMAPKPKSTLASHESKTAISSTISEPSKKAKKAKAKDPSPSPEPTFPSDDDSVEGDVRFDSEEDDEVHLHGFSTDDDDSSDEEGGMDFEAAPLDVTKLPTVAKDDATVKRKLDKAKRQPTEDRGVLFLGRLPHGFYEDQLKAYFSQFGTVTRLRVSRNKNTGRSKHYAFLEFDSLAVAQIVADTMDNYLLMGHILRCKVIPKDEVHPELWIGANRKWRPVPRARITRMEHNKSRTTDEQARAAKRLIKRQNARKRKLAEAGMGYDFDAVSYKKPKET